MKDGLQSKVHSHMASLN